MAVVTNGGYLYSGAGCVTNISYSGVQYSRSLSLAWDGFFQLSSVSTNGVALEEYGYDALGRRVFVASGSTTNWIVWDGIHPAAEVDGSGNLKKSYLWGGVDRLLSLTVIDGQTTNVLIPLTDYLGTVHALADSSGNVVESYRYDAHGRVLGVYDEDGQAISESAVGNSVLWGGKFYSWAVHGAMGSGLYQNRARVLDPCTGRFLSKDPIGIAGGTHEYLYAGGDPVNQTDPLGLVDITVGAEIFTTPSVSDMGHTHLFQGVDQGVHLHGSAGSKFFPRTGMILTQSGQWVRGSGRFLKQYAEALRQTPAAARAVARALELAEQAGGGGAGYVTAGAAVAAGEVTLVAGVGVAVYYGGLHDPVLQECAQWWAHIFGKLFPPHVKSPSNVQLRRERPDREAPTQDPYRRDK